MAILQTVKNKIFNQWFNISFYAQKAVDDYSQVTYGVSRTKDGSKIDNHSVEYNLARHLLSNKDLNELARLLLSEDGAETQKTTDTAKKLHELYQNVKDMGVVFKVENKFEHRKQLIVYIDQKNNPEQAIRDVMKGLGVNNEKCIDDAIDRFNKEPRTREEHDKITHTVIDNGVNSESTHKGDSDLQLSDILASDISGVETGLSDLKPGGGSNASLGNHNTEPTKSR